MRVDEERVRAFVDRVLEVEREASGGGAIGDFERSLHHNVCAVVVNLAADVASTIRLGCFGHDLTLDVRPIAAWLDTLTTEELRRQHIKTLEVLRRFADENARLREAAPCDAVALEKALLRLDAPGKVDRICDVVRDMITVDTCAKLSQLVKARRAAFTRAWPPLDRTPLVRPLQPHFAPW